MDGEKGGRICLYDNVKFLLIVLVVIGHFTQGYKGLFQSVNVFIYSFHMPLFLFLAGLFYKGEAVASKAAGYACVGVLLKGCGMLADRLTGGTAALRLLGGWNVPWFMFVLAGYEILSYGLRNVPKRFVLFAAVLTACLAGYDSSVGDGFYLSRLIVFYPFFVLGQMCDREKLAAASRRPALRWAALAVLAAWGALCLLAREQVYPLRTLFLGRKPYAAVQMFLPWGFFWRLLCYAVTLVTGAAVLCLTPSARMPVVTLMGGRTIQIYFWHFIVQTLIAGYGSALCATREGKALWLLLAVLTALVTGLKPFSFPTKQILRAAKGPPAEREK